MTDPQGALIIGAMAAEPFHDLISSIRTRIHAELEAQLPALAAAHAAEVGAARTAAEAEAESKWSALLEEHKTRARTEAEASMAAARAAGPDARALVDALGVIDAAATVSGLLTAVATAAAAHSARAALYVGPGLDPWNGAAAPDAAPVLRDAMATGRTIRKSTGGIVVPLLLDGAAVAVVEAESAEGSDRWVETIEIIVRYGAAQIAALTALETAHAARWLQRAASGSPARPSGQEAEEPVQAARRYARLLISEIKLYNEAAVDEGRAHRDLARRLAPEIERARRLYEERVPHTVADRVRHFEHELVQTLAGGDPALLGGT